MSAGECRLGAARQCDPQPHSSLDRCPGSTATSMPSRRGRLDQHRQPLDPRRPADRRRVRAAEAFDQAVIAAAGDHRALRAEPVGDELEGGVAVIIEAAHQPRIAGPGDAGGIEPGGHRRRRSRPPRRSGNRRSPARCRRSGSPAAPCCRGCAADSSSSRSRLSSDRSPRCASKCSTSAARQASRVAASPSVLSLSVDRVGDAELAEQLVGHGDQLDVGGRRRVPMISASSWWNWRKRPFCGRS